MKKLIIYLYELLPRSLIRAIGSSKLLQPVRDVLLRPGGQYKITKVRISREYGSYLVSFIFYATIKVAARAKSKGIENRLIRKSIEQLKELKRDDAPVIMDVGGNFGYLSMTWASSIAKDSGRVYCFEPSRGIYEVLKGSVEENHFHTNLEIINSAVGETTGTIDVYDNGISANRNELKGVNSTYKIQMTSIDHFCVEKDISRVDLIKIDVDGSELNVLQGAESAIKKFKPVLIVETNKDVRIVRFCTEAGYRIFDFNMNEYNAADGLPDNVICIPN